MGVSQLNSWHINIPILYIDRVKSRVGFFSAPKVSLADRAMGAVVVFYVGNL